MNGLQCVDSCGGLEGGLVMPQVVMLLQCVIWLLVWRHVFLYIEHSLAGCNSEGQNMPLKIVCGSWSPCPRFHRPWGHIYELFLDEMTLQLESIFECMFLVKLTE